MGIAYTSLWYPKKQQGTALGIFGAGNAGAALTSMGAPVLLRMFTDGGVDPDGWRLLPKIYAAALVVMTLAFWSLTFSKKVEHGHEMSLAERLRPLKEVRVWRFGLYYFFVFGGFVALAQWLIPYYVNAYTATVATAGLLASIYTLPSGVIRALGGWLSDKFGARTVMYWVLGGSALCCFLLIMPRMDVFAPGEGVMAMRGGEVTSVADDHVEVDGMRYDVRVREGNPKLEEVDRTTLIMPSGEAWQEPVVKLGDKVSKRQLLARGVTRVFFQANIWVFTAIVFIIGILMGIGKAAVYKHIPEYFPKDVGVVGGIVGVLGGLGGFTCPILFGLPAEWDRDLDHLLDVLLLAVDGLPHLDAFGHPQDAQGARTAARRAARRSRRPPPPRRPRADGADASQTPRPRLGTSKTRPLGKAAPRRSPSATCGSRFPTCCVASPSGCTGA